MSLLLPAKFLLLIMKACIVFHLLKNFHSHLGLDLCLSNIFYKQIVSPPKCMKLNKYMCWEPESFDQKYTSKSWPNFIFNVVTKFQGQNLCQTSASKSWPNGCQDVTQHQHQQHQEVLSWHLQRPESYQSSLLNRSESVSLLLTRVANDRTWVW